RDVFSGGWRGWWPVGEQSAPAGAPIGAATTGPDRLDIVVAGDGGHVAWASWNQSVGADWQSWPRLGGLALPPRGHLGTVARAGGRLDLFAIGTDGAIAASSHLNGWSAWRPIAGMTAAPGAPVAADSRDGQSLDVFAVAADGGVHTATLDHA